MVQSVSAPDIGSFDGLLSQHPLYVDLGLIGAGERNNQIQVHTSLQDEARASKQPVYFAEATESVAINGQQIGGLFDHLFVGHEYPPAKARKHSTTTANAAVLNYVARKTIRSLVAASQHFAGFRVAPCSNSGTSVETRVFA